MGDSRENEGSHSNIGKSSEHDTKRSGGKTQGTGNRYLLAAMCMVVGFEGAFLMVIGSLLPVMGEAYSLDYNAKGMLLTVHNFGNSIAALIAGAFFLIFGFKKSINISTLVACLGLFAITGTGRYPLLIILFLITGVARGCMINYSNQAVTVRYEGAAGPINFLQACFSIGSVFAPILVLLCTVNGIIHWKLAIYITAAIGALSWGMTFFLKNEPLYEKKNTRESVSLGFLREKDFIISLLIMFFYMSIEAVVFGWIPTFFENSGVILPKYQGYITTLLWVMLLVGRIIFSMIGNKIKTTQLLFIPSVTMVLSIAFLIISKNPVVLIGAVVILGLSMSGMYGNILANAGTVFMTYPISINILNFIGSFGGVVTPIIVGRISHMVDIRVGMSAIMIPAVITLICTILNIKMKNPDRNFCPL